MTDSDSHHQPLENDSSEHYDGTGLTFSLVMVLGPVLILMGESGKMSRGDRIDHRHTLVTPHMPSRIKHFTQEVIEVTPCHRFSKEKPLSSITAHFG